ncbi:hemin uptake protein HemP [Frigidibacter sp. MR17.24]|uniref:hemin uptake protein HemP n=1 Tax=Frigidibacter sp. MR17.24 TaxID=3127345 RepID=UPI003012CE66
MNATVQTDFTRADIARYDELPVHDATRLTEGGVQARILLNGQCYTLRITRAGKLILTK